MAQLMEISQPNGGMIIIEHERRGLFMEYWANDKLQVAAAEITFNGKEFVLKSVM